MSDLYRKLGPEGRRLLSRGSGSGNVSSSDHIPQELDFLINELRFPKPTTTVNNILGYLYQYLPYVKQEYNLRLIISSFLNCPVCFSPPAPFLQSYSIIEVFKLITDKKLKVSQPTLSIKTYYLIILKELTNFVNYNPVNNSWKVLPIISGMSMSNELAYELYTELNAVEYKWFFYEWNKKMGQLFKKALNYSIAPSQSDDINYLALLSLAVTFKKGEPVNRYTSHIAPQFIIYKLTELLFESPKSANVYRELLVINDESQAGSIIQTPVVRYINKLSFILEAYVQTLPHKYQSFELIMTISKKMLYFNRELNFATLNSGFNHKTSASNQSELNKQYWYVLKLILFAEIIIFQGILTRFAVTEKPQWRNRHMESITSQNQQLSLVILHNLYYTNFILLAIGQGGFDSYNFVYYFAVDLASQNQKHFEGLTMELIGNYQELNMHPDVVNNSYVIQSKIIFVLGLWEIYMQQNLPHGKFQRDIFEICFDLADTKTYNVYEITEASHSVLLVYFSQAKFENLPECIQYVDMLFEQHPQSLSATQLNIAIETIGKKILSSPIIYQNSKYETSSDEFLEYLYRKCGAAPSIAIAPAINSTVESSPAKQPYEFEERIVPNTTRESAVTTIINLIPYLPLSKFNFWLDRIWVLIEMSHPEEKVFLIGILWKVISENLDLNRSELAYHWWYEVKQLPLIGINPPKL